MLKRYEQHQIHELFNAGLGATEIAKRTNRSLGTVYKYKLMPESKKVVTAKSNTTVPDELKLYVGIIDKGIGQKNKSRDIYFELQKEGYLASRLIFEAYYKKRKQELNPLRSIRHLETDPGEQAQVDWAHFGQITINGKKEKLYLFVFILSWSRAIYLEFVVRQNQRTLQACHMNAFNKLGIPKVILYDNMKTVVSRREKMTDGTKKIHYNLAFNEFARYYQFTPEACSPYWPRHKGKVERTIRYVRNNFSRYTPKTNITLDELNEQLTRWVDTTAQQREHKTTYEKPYERWLEEKQFLSFPVNLPPYNLSSLRSHYTSQYGVLHHDGSFYCLGVSYARKKFDVLDIQKHGLPMLEIYHKNEIVMTLPAAATKRSWVSVEEDMPSIQPQLASKAQVKEQPRKRRSKHISIAVTVEKRDLSYYAIPSDIQEGAAHG